MKIIAKGAKSATAPSVLPAQVLVKFVNLNTSILVLLVLSVMITNTFQGLGLLNHVSLALRIVRPAQMEHLVTSVIQDLSIIFLVVHANRINSPRLATKAVPHAIKTHLILAHSARIILFASQ